MRAVTLPNKTPAPLDVAPPHRPTQQCAGFVNLGPRYAGPRCSRSGTVEHDGSWYCRTHAPVVPRIEEDVYEDAIDLCACGCGEPVNLWLPIFRSHVRDGLKYREIAEFYGLTRSYVGRLIAHPPKYVKGHSATDYWASAAGRQRQERWAESVAIRRIRAVEGRVARERRRREREWDRKTKERERLERREARELTGSMFHRGLICLDVALQTERHALMDPASDPLHLVEQDELRETLLSVVGTLEPDDVRLIDGATLERIQDRLRDLGISPHGVTRAERERLRDPDAHSGRGVLRSKSRGSRETSAQKRAGSSHRKRIMQPAAKHQERQMRRSRKARPVPSGDWSRAGTQ